MSITKIINFIPFTIYENLSEDTYGTLSWMIRNGYPRVTVYTESNRNVKEAFDYNKLIIAPFDLFTFNMFVKDFESIINAKPGTKKAIKCYNVKYENNVKTNDIHLQATVIIGKDDTGVIYLAVVAEGKKRVKFRLLPNTKWHKFVDENGNEIIDKKELSVKYSQVYIEQLKALVNKYLHEDSQLVKIKSNENDLTLPSESNTDTTTIDNATSSDIDDFTSDDL